MQATASAPPSSSSSTTLGLGLRRSASVEWREWEETLDALSCAAASAGSGFDVDVAGFDHMLLGNADEFLEPFAEPPTPVFATDSEFFYEREHDLSILEAAGVDATFPFGAGEQPMAAVQSMEPAQQQQRKRKTGENGQHQSEKKIKREAAVAEVMKYTIAPEAEQLYRRRYDILQEILEAWNTGVIEDMEEIAGSVYDDEVTLFGPDFAEGLRGVGAVLAHWNNLLDAFPDGIMEEYDVQREDLAGDKLKATWVFSGTQIFPIYGVEPRHQKVKISGTTFYTFKGDKIQQSVITWNYRETLLKLMGVQPSRSGGVVLSAHVMAGPHDGHSA